MDLSIVIVSWNVKEKLRECLRSLPPNFSAENLGGQVEETLLHNAPQPPLTLRGGAVEVFVVDNDSKDETVQMVEKEFPSVHVIANNFNAGFAKANNQAIRLSQGRYVLLLNPDMRVLPGALENMVRFMGEERNKKVGVAGCHLVSPSPALRAPSPAGRGTIADSSPRGRGEGEGFVTVPHVRRFPTIKDQLAIMLKVSHLFPHLLDSYMMADFDYSKEARVDSIRGSFFMIRREVLNKIGLLDEGFFIWFEEVDFCKRAIAAGYEIVYTPIAKAIDYVGQSFKQVKFYPKQKMFTRSMVYYFKKHAPAWQYRLVWALRPIALAVAWVGDIVRSKIRIKQDKD